MKNDVVEKLNEAGLEMQPYWSIRYLKNIDKLSKPIYKKKYLLCGPDCSSYI